MKLTKEQFNDLFLLNPSGNPDHTFQAVEYYMENDNIDFDDNTVDFKYIYDRYKEYLAWWKDTWGKRDQKFVGKTDKLKSIYEFLNAGDHKKSFVVTPTNRIFYLTNNKSISNLKIDLAKFIKRTTKHG
jgi:hypothetical protein